MHIDTCDPGLRFATRQLCWWLGWSQDQQTCIMHRTFQHALHSLTCRTYVYLYVSTSFYIFLGWSLPLHIVHPYVSALISTYSTSLDQNITSADLVLPILSHLTVAGPAFLLLLVQIGPAIYLSIYLSIYLVKINSTCTRCDCIVTQHLLYSGQLSQSLDPRALQHVILYTSGITILYTHLYFNTVPQIVEEQHCFQTLWKYKIHCWSQLCINSNCQAKSL